MYLGRGFWVLVSILSVSARLSFAVQNQRVLDIRQAVMDTIDGDASKVQHLLDGANIAMMAKVSGTGRNMSWFISDMVAHQEIFSNIHVCTHCFLLD